MNLSTISLADVRTFTFVLSWVLAEWYLQWKIKLVLLLNQWKNGCERTDGKWTLFPVFDGPKKGVLSPDGVSTVSPLLSIVGLSETTPGSRPACRASPTSGRAISGSGLGAPPDLSGRISPLLVDSWTTSTRLWMQYHTRGLERQNGFRLV